MPKPEEEICEALGLKRVVSLEISLRVNQPAIISVKYLAEKEDTQKLALVLKKYKLVPRYEEEKNDCR